MMNIFTFPDTFEPEECLYPTILKAGSTLGDMEALTRVLRKNPALREQLFNAMEQEVQ